MTQRYSKSPIAVIGVGALFPGDPAPDGFWRDIVAGRDCLSDVPPSHWLIEDYYDPDPKRPGKTYGRRGGFLKPVSFDPMEAGIPPTALPNIDTAQLLALLVAQRVLNDACGLRFDSVDRTRTSVILGVASATELVNTMSGTLQRPVWTKALRDEGLPEDQVTAICDRIAAHYVDWTENTFPGLLGNVTAGRVANRFDLGGTNCVIDAACASSLGALQMAMQELWNGDADMAITGGVDALNDIFMFMCFSKTPAMSPTGDCRPFSTQADGTMLGEGVGMFALRRLEDAERDGNRIYAVLQGIGSSSDGRAKSIYAPRAEGQERALSRAYAAAGYGPDTVELVEAHGTGTSAGDAAEVQALKAVFARSGRTDHGWCALGSVKSQIGHTKAAAGAAALYKAVMALHHKVLPPTIKVAAVNPALGLAESPFRINTTARPWIGHGRHPRRASVSSFGFGGSNFHLTLEEYRGAAPRPPRIRSLPSELLLLSSATREELLEKMRDLGVKASQGDWALSARESQVSFDPSAGHRLAVVAADAEALSSKLDAARQKLANDRQTSWHVQGVAYGAGERASGKVAFLFPGQGSQYVGMAADVAMAFPRSGQIWDDANANFVRSGLGPLSLDVFPPAPLTPEERASQIARLTETDRAQPAIGVTSRLLLDLLREAGISPDFCAGHSFGEVTALHCAGVLDSDDFLKVSRERGRLMAEAARSTPGAMLAVSASADKVGQLLEGAPRLVIANINGPEQVVVAGTVEDIEAFSARLSTLQMSPRRLPVATAFHSPIVAGAVPAFAKMLTKVSFEPPRVMVMAGSTAAPYPDEPDAIRDLLARQVAEPVRFVEQISALYQKGARVFIEVGPRAVVTDLVSRCLAGQDHIAIATNTAAATGVSDLWMALGRLAAMGMPLDLSFAWESYSTTAEAKPVPSPVTVKITGANYGKVYPPQGSVVRAPVMPAKRKPAATPSPLPSAPAPAVSMSAPAVSESNAGRLGAGAGADSAWLSALQQMQAQTAEAHAVAQRAMADAHIAYLKAAESGLAQLREIATLENGVSNSLSAALAPPPELGLFMPARTDGRMMPGPAMAETLAPPPVPDAMPLPPSPSAAMVAAAPSSASQNLGDILLGIVAEKTGYPRDILGLDLDLEADLGVDSIKRVEILSALAEARPDLPAVDGQTLGSLRTLGAILKQLGLSSDLASPVVVAASKTSAALVTSAAPAAPAAGVTELVLNVVAEKTGYPREILGLDMDLEADLGIDSIKRVEILAAVAEARPDLPAVDGQTLGSLRTLGAILKQLGFPAVAADPGRFAPAGMAAAGGAPPSASSTAGLTGIVLDVVAEKTGYPREILGLEMDLEADLGIDSIKRVEILAAVAEARPELPPIDPEMLGSMRTLGAILAHLAGERPAAVNGAALTEPTSDVPEAAGKIARRGVREVPVQPGNQAGFYGLGAARKIAIIDDGSELGSLVADRLQTHGVSSEIARCVPADADGVIVIDSAKHPDDDTALNSARQAFTAAQAFAATAGKHGGTFITVQDSGGDFGLSGKSNGNAWMAGAPGLIKTLAQEWPRARPRAIDLERDGRDPGELADCLVDELMSGAHREVGLRADGRRTTLEEFALPPTGSFDPSWLGEKPVLVVSGGARGVTAACIVALAGVTRLRLALIGRTPLEDEPVGFDKFADEASLKAALLADARARGETVTPRQLAERSGRIVASREIRGTLQRLTALGSEAVYACADVADAAAVAHAVSAARTGWGRIDGLVHGAGTLADKRVEDKSVEQFERVFTTKVLGLRAMLAATQDDELRLICLFSSGAARYGNAGQADYAVANEVLNKVARAEAARRGAKCHVRSLNWGPWDGGMVSPALREHFVRRGIPVIKLEDGAAAFVDEICRQGGNLSHVDVALGSSLATES